MMELKVVVPTTLSEITLEQYQRFARLEGDEEFLTKKALEIFCNVPLDQLPSIRFRDVSNVTRLINEMMRQKPQLTPIFKMGDVEYGFIPSLEDITYGEFVDLDTNLQDVQNLHRTMAVLYRPITERIRKRYRVEDYRGDDSGAEAMKQAPMDVVMGAVLFFWTLGSELLSNILTSLEGIQMQETTIPQNPNSPSDGAGTTPSIPLLREMLDDLMKYQGYPFTNALPSLPTKSRKSN